MVLLILFADSKKILVVSQFCNLIAIFLFRRSLELNKAPIQIIFGLICGGIAGNLSDRIFREPAAVVDFIDVFIPWLNYDYPIFNIADSGIFIGAFSYFFIGLMESRREKLQVKAGKPL